MYSMNCTSPDHGYVKSMTSKYQQYPMESHWIELKNILKYLSRTTDMFLVYGGMEESLGEKCYTDDSFTTNQDDCKLQSGYMFIVNGGAMSRKSSK